MGVFGHILLLIVGFVLLIKGADWFVKGAAAIAHRYNVSDLVIGLTIVAFGTSAPELVVNVIASFQNHQGIVFGNVIGSNNMNLFLILGVVGLISPLRVPSSTLWKEIPISFLAVLVLLFLANDYLVLEKHILSRVEGIILLILFGAFLGYVYIQLKRAPRIRGQAKSPASIGKILYLSTLGIVGLVLGGKLIVPSAVAMASLLGVSEKIIGITIVAAGTSLPELVTSVVAAARKRNDMAVGNIIGSNIFNIFLILGVSAVIRPIPYDAVFNFDTYVLGLGTLFLFFAVLMGKKGRLGRWQAGLLTLAYFVYLGLLIMKEIS